jgi:DNA-binding transcriptional MerR regulator
MEQYLKRNIADILEISPRKVQYYTDEFLVIPDVQPPSGKGSPRIYSHRNLIEFAMVLLMSGSFGVPLNLISTILMFLRDGQFKHDRLGSTKFEDFYTSDSWGMTKELIFITTTFGLPKINQYPIWLAVSEADEQGKFSVDQAINDSGQGDRRCITILKLGGIKRAALDLIER